MLLTWAFRKVSIERLALILVGAGIAAGAAAQALPKAQAPVARTIILPPKIVAGSAATLAVLDSAGRLLPNVVVELAGGQKVTTDATGRASFVAPTEAGKLTAKISGKEITASSLVGAVKDSRMQSSTDLTTVESRIISYPRVLAVHDRFTIEGTGFRGVPDLNKVFLADQSCLVVASSPVSLVVLPGPHVPIGAITLRVSVAGHDTQTIPVSAVLLDFSGPVEASNAGAQGKIILQIHGSTERLDVEVRNASPEIIQLPGGNVQRLGTSGGEQNIAPLDLKFIAAGNYTVTARLIPTVTDTTRHP